MKKKYFITAIVFGILGLIYGSIANYFVRDEKILFLSIISGIFVGLLIFAMYYILTFFLGFQYEEDSSGLDKCIKMLIRIQNLIVFNALIFGQSLLIASGGAIKLPLLWIHLIDIVIAIIVITKANFDGKAIRKSRTKEIRKVTQVNQMSELISTEQVKHLISTAPNLDIADQILESVTGLTEPRDKYLFIKKVFEDSLINVSLNSAEEVYMDILKQVVKQQNLN